ncbi:MAG: SGNH/GDSL hydrolase family protein [Cyanobacteria bacterium J06627_28]
MTLFKGLPIGLTTALSATAAIALSPFIILQSPSPAKAADYSQIYSFGDSLVDTGNTFSLSKSFVGEGFPPPPYFEGRFANGPLWNEYLAEDLGVPLTNFGFAGARSSRDVNDPSEGTIPGFTLPGLLTQVDQFTANQALLDPNALYLVSSGANDYLSGGEQNPQKPVLDITAALLALSEAGAQHIVVGNQPPLGSLPAAKQLGISDPLNQLSEAHNQGLALAISGLTANGLKIDLLDINGLIRDAQAGKFGFENTTDPCISDLACLMSPEVQATTLFWDDEHPTTRAHFLVAEAALEQLEAHKVSTPEPGTLVGIMFLGGLAVSQLKRKLDKV